MIVIVSSCIKPLQNGVQLKSYLSVADREMQTLFTLEKLEAYHFSKVILVDNSVDFDFSNIKKKFENVEIVHIKQYQFENKGLNELLMLLAIVDELPNNEPIFKISGRYYPNEAFKATIGTSFDFRVRGYDFGTKRGNISTRAYFVKNKQLYKDFLLKTFNEVFLYPGRIVGLRSLIKAMIASVRKPLFFPNFNASIEFSAARVLINDNYTLDVTDSIGIQGEIAGFEGSKEIIE